jgi:hypothetical protein
VGTVLISAGHSHLTQKFGPDGHSFNLCDSQKVIEGLGLSSCSTCQHLAKREREVHYHSCKSVSLAHFIRMIDSYLKYHWFLTQNKQFNDDSNNSVPEKIMDDMSVHK